MWKFIITNLITIDTKETDKLPLGTERKALRASESKKL